jgi:hypothetical protein
MGICQALFYPFPAFFFFLLRAAQNGFVQSDGLFGAYSEPEVRLVEERFPQIRSSEDGWFREESEQKLDLTAKRADVWVIPAFTLQV